MHAFFTRSATLRWILGILTGDGLHAVYVEFSTHWGGHATVVGNNLQHHVARAVKHRNATVRIGYGDHVIFFDNGSKCVTVTATDTIVYVFIFNVPVGILF